MASMSRVHTDVDSPIGRLTLVGEDGALVGLYLEQHRRRPAPEWFGPDVGSGFEDLTAQLQEYFAGVRTDFELAIRPRGTGFERRVWDAVARIPYGRTRSYGDLARDLGDPGLAQAVGAANARNPVCIVVPCHRVVGADGSLTGYAGGLERKRFLLDLEQPPGDLAGRLF
jgi:methylated-DNA-[protein]-cysteine S-methyltransferase